MHTLLDDPQQEPKTPASVPEKPKEFSLEDTIDQAENDSGLPKGFLRALQPIESDTGHYKNGKVATSPTGARGAFQFTKKTAKQYGINRDDMQQNVYGAALLAQDNYRELKPLVDNDADLWAAVAASHNRGVAAVKRMIRGRKFEPAGSDGYKHTSNYVDQFANNFLPAFEEYQKEKDSTISYTQQPALPEAQAGIQGQKAPPVPAPPVQVTSGTPAPEQGITQPPVVLAPPPTTQASPLTLGRLLGKPQPGAVLLEPRGLTTQAASQTALEQMAANSGLDAPESQQFARDYMASLLARGTPFHLQDPATGQPIDETFLRSVEASGNFLQIKLGNQGLLDAIDSRLQKKRLDAAVDEEAQKRADELKSGNVDKIGLSLFSSPDYFTEAGVRRDVQGRMDADNSRREEQAKALSQFTPEDYQNLKQSLADIQKGGISGGIALGASQWGSSLAYKLAGLSDLAVPGGQNPLGDLLRKSAASNELAISQPLSSDQVRDATAFLTQTVGALAEMYGEVGFAGPIAGFAAPAYLEAQGRNLPIAQKIKSAATQGIIGAGFHGAGKMFPALAPETSTLGQRALQTGKRAGVIAGTTFTTEGAAGAGPTEAAKAAAINAAFDVVPHAAAEVLPREAPKQPSIVPGPITGQPKPIREEARQPTQEPQVRTVQGKPAAVPEKAVPDIQRIADKYVRASNGRRQLNPDIGNAPVPEELTNKIADWYQEAKHEPDAPEVRKAYDSLKTEIGDQFESLQNNGYTFQRGEAAQTSAAVRKDLADNKHLTFQATEVAGNIPDNHPFALESPYRDSDGKPLLWNDVFRIVHDTWGHGLSGTEFGPRGEWNTTRAHMNTLSPEAQKAVFAETQGQNSTINAGKALRRPDGTLPKPGDNDFVPLEKRAFAEQKATVPPDSILNEWRQVNAETKQANPPPAGVNPSTSASKAYISATEAKKPAQPEAGPVEERAARTASYTDPRTGKKEPVKVLSEEKVQVKVRPGEKARSVARLTLENRHGEKLFASPKDVEYTIPVPKEAPKRPVRAENVSTVSVNDVDANISTPKAKNFQPVRLPNGKTATIIGPAGPGKVRVRLDEVNKRGQNTITTVSKNSIELIKVPSKSATKITETEAPGTRTGKSRPQVEAPKETEPAKAKRNQVASSEGEPLPVNKRYIRNKEGDVVPVISATEGFIEAADGSTFRVGREKVIPYVDDADAEGVKHPGELAQKASEPLKKNEEPPSENPFNPVHDSIGRPVKVAAVKESSTEDTIQYKNWATVSGKSGEFDNTDNLAEQLADAGLSISRAAGHYGGESEPSLFVRWETPEDLAIIRRLAKKSKQESVLVSNSITNQFSMQYVSGKAEGTESYSEDLRIGTLDPKEGYTRVYNLDGSYTDFTVKGLFDEGAKLRKSADESALAGNIPFEDKKVSQVVRDNAERLLGNTRFAVNDDGKVVASHAMVDFLRDHGIFGETSGGKYLGITLDRSRIEKAQNAIKKAKYLLPLERAALDRAFTTTSNALPIIFLHQTRTVNEIKSTVSHESIHVSDILASPRNFIRWKLDALQWDKLEKNPAIVSYMTAVRKGPSANAYGSLPIEFTASEIMAHYGSGDWAHLGVPDKAIREAYIETLEALNQSNKNVKISSLVKEAINPDAIEAATEIINRAESGKGQGESSRAPENSADAGARGPGGISEEPRRAGQEAGNTNGQRDELANRRGAKALELAQVVLPEKGKEGEEFKRLQESLVPNAEKQTENQKIANFDKAAWLERVLDRNPARELTGPERNKFNGLISEAQSARQGYDSASEQDKPLYEKELRKKTKALVKFYGEQDPERLLGLVAHLTRASLLTGYNVLVRNAVSNTLHSAAESASRYGALGADWAIYATRKFTGGSAEHYSPTLVNLVKSDAYSAAALLKNTIPAIRNEMRGTASQVIKGQGLNNPVSARVGIFNPLADVANLAYRFTSAQDQPYREYARARAIYDLVAGEVRNDKTVPKSQKNAEMQKRLAQPSPQILDMAERIAAIAVFQGPNKLAERWSAATSSLEETELKRGARFLLNWNVPFVKTSLNILNATLDYAGVRQPFHKLWEKGVGKQLDFEQAVSEAHASLDGATKRAVRMAFGRGLIGWGTIALGAGLARSGLLTPSFDDKQSQGERNTEEAAGSGPGRMKLGNYWIDLRYLGPQAALLLAGANLYVGTTRKEGAVDKSAAAAQTVMSVLTRGNPLMDSSMNAAESLSKGDIRGMMKTMVQPERLVPGVVGEAARFQDRPTAFSVSGTARDTTGNLLSENITNRVKEKLPKTFLNPNFNRQSLPVKTDVLGSPVQQPNPLYPLAPKSDQSAMNNGARGEMLNRGMALTRSTAQDEESKTALKERQTKEGQNMATYLGAGVNQPGYTGNEKESLNRLAQEGRGTAGDKLQPGEKGSNARLIVRSVEAEKTAKNILSKHTELTPEQQKEVLTKVRALFSSNRAERTKNLGLTKRLAVEADIAGKMYSNPRLFEVTVEQLILDVKQFKE